MEKYNTKRVLVAFYVIYCLATVRQSNCTKTISAGKDDNYFHFDDEQEYDEVEIKQDDQTSQEYVLCKKLLNKKLCKTCFPVIDSPQKNPLSHVEASTTAHELTLISSLVASRLAEGACSSSTSSPPSRHRRSTTSDDDDPSIFIKAVYEKYGTSSGVMNTSVFGYLLRDLGIGDELDSTPSTAANVDPTQAIIQHCYTATALLDIFNLTDGISEANFGSISPSLIQQIVQGCVAVETKTSEMPIEMYGWATLAVASITILSMLAMIAVPTSGSRFYAAVMQLFVALAVSSLSGDALLHLLPEALGIHGLLHSKGDPNHILIILTVVLALYFFFLFERVMSLCLKGKPHGHGHVHSRPRRPTFCEDENSEFVRVTQTLKESEDEKDTDNNNVGLELKEIHDVQKRSPQTGRICGLSTLVVMVLIGDIVHNMTDGLTIGVSFANGQFSGISTTIAVFFHEIPHEIGDFAVMLRSGVPFKKAMLCSLISNLLGFIGLYIGLYLGSANVFQRWIFAATAGMFLYIALVSLVPEMNQQAEETHSRPWRVLLRHNIGLLLGWFIMLGIGFYEQHKETI